MLYDDGGMRTQRRTGKELERAGFWYSGQNLEEFFDMMTMSIVYGHRARRTRNLVGQLELGDSCAKEKLVPVCEPYWVESARNDRIIGPRF